MDTDETSDGGGAAGGGAPAGGDGRPPDRDALVADLRRVADHPAVDGTPSWTAHAEWGRHHPRQLVAAFGTWPAALTAAALDPAGAGAGDDRAPGDDALVADLRRVAGVRAGDRSGAGGGAGATARDREAHGEVRGGGADPGGGGGAGGGGGGAGAGAGAGGDGGAGGSGESAAPTIREYADRGDHSPQTLRGRFGSWPGALDAAGLDGDAARERRTAALTGDRGPSPGGGADGTGGTDTPPTGGGTDGGARTVVSDDALVADLRRVAAREDTATPPTTRDYAAHGEHCTTTCRRAFGSWAAALAAADLDADGRRERGGGDREALAATLARVAARPDTADPPAPEDLEAHADRPPRAYRRRFGSWRAAVTVCLTTPGERGLLAGLRAAAARGDTADPPTAGDVERCLPFAPDDYAAAFGSLEAALAAAGLGGGGGGDGGGEGGGGEDAADAAEARVRATDGGGVAGRTADE